MIWFPVASKAQVKHPVETVDRKTRRPRFRRCAYALALCCAGVVTLGYISGSEPFTLEEAKAEAIRILGRAGIDAGGLRVEMAPTRRPDRRDPMFVVDVPGPRSYSVIVDRDLRKWSAISETRQELVRRQGSGRTGAYAIGTEAEARRALLAMAGRLGAPSGCVIDSLTLKPRPGSPEGTGFAVVSAQVGGRVLGKPVFGRFYGMRVMLDGFDGSLAGANQSWALPPIEDAPQRIGAAQAVELALTDDAARSQAALLGPIVTMLGYLASIDGRSILTPAGGRMQMRSAPPMTVMRHAWEVTYARRSAAHETSPGRVVRERVWVDASTGEVSCAGP